ASSRHAVALVPLRFPLVPVARFQEDFHLQVIAHAGRTTEEGHPVSTRWPSLVSCRGRLRRGLQTQRSATGQANLALPIDAQDLDEDLVTLSQHIRGVLDPTLGQLRDVAETVRAREELDDRAEVTDAAHRTQVDFAHLGLAGQTLHDLDGLVE